jgi:hypothetical protein
LDLAIIRDLDTQLKEYIRKYEQAKTELRSLNGNFSIFFLSLWTIVTDIWLYSDISTVLTPTQDD